jgi:hypothetical protein
MSPSLSSPLHSHEKDDSDDLAHFNPLAIAAAAAAAAANAANAPRFPASLYSAALGGNPLAFLPPTFNIPALSALPLHKQMLLSPLLASGHLWATARKAYPFLSPSPAATSDVSAAVSEHQALLERFRSSLSSPPLSAAFKSSVANVDLGGTSDDESSSMTAGSMPHLSDTDDDVIEDRVPSPAKRKDEKPLDLTCA